MQSNRVLVWIAALGGSLLPVLMAAEASGKIEASPNPCVIERGEKMCASHITWSTHDVKHARVFVKNEGKQGMEEHEFGNGLSCESQKCRAPWIRERTSYTFTLYDYSSGSRGRELASVTVTAKGGEK